jgi:hypothetical protein
MLPGHRVPTVCAVHIVLSLCTNMDNFTVVLLLFFVVKLLQLMCAVVASCNFECFPFAVFSIVFRVA